VLCTVCWVRLDGEHPTSKRARILNLVSQPVTAVAVGAMVLAVGVGATLVTTSQSAPAAVVAAAASVASPSAQPTPSASAADAPVVTAVPLAATVADPLVSGTPGTCLLTAGEQQIDCRLEGDSVRFDVCVPATAADLQVRTRASAEDPWQDVPADVVLLSGGTCEAPELRADVAIEAAAFSVSDEKWRLVARDDAQDKVWSSKLRPAAPQG
jgi:hypothetical protein